ncbi:hypothetical protein GVY41_02665 [Frigidibacter albus]|uniref:DUF2946 domain-containing protein n=1 Tax=Frigidibacter albus TaxID=1465486 RepID=A0A6L8VGT5_9RHOB|nr:hypothetical protein [Frigidibacter albus]MZQ88420.1 hypothetical protein [Frigidibacter albus]NBE29906.1 hypothetical protein [Frigidibacter albus]GGH45484.1 hypothetical protein GCM10011341_05370 [Frigidibacter albus]
MYRIAHTLSGVILALALVLTGSGATGPAHGATMQVICGSDGTSTIWLDGDGTPVNPDENHSKCLNCLPSAAVIPEAAVVLSTLIAQRIAAGPVRPNAALPGPVAHLRPDPRGSPALPPGDPSNGDRPTNARLPHQSAAKIDFYQSHARTSVTDLRATSQDAPA